MAARLCCSPPSARTWPGARWSGGDVEDLDAVEPHPHFIVASAMCSCMRVLMVLRSERDWSRVISPKTARSAVRDNWSTPS